MRSLTPTALSILARNGKEEGRITKCAVDPETNDVYATTERMEDGVEVGLVKYEITPEGVHTEVSSHYSPCDDRAYQDRSSDHFHHP